jgi:hypothetical protein
MEKLVSVRCPKELEPIFLKAEKLVKEFFANQEHDPTKAVRTISGDRYMLVRAEVLGYWLRKKHPDERLGPGPIHFNYSGFAFVELLPESHPSPDDDYLSVYNHPHSFEAEMQLKMEGKSKICVCNLTAGYSARRNSLHR